MPRVPNEAKWQQIRQKLKWKIRDQVTTVDRALDVENFPIFETFTLCLYGLVWNIFKLGFRLHGNALSCAAEDSAAFYHPLSSVTGEYKALKIDKEDCLLWFNTEFTEFHR